MRFYFLFLHARCYLNPFFLPVSTPPPPPFCIAPSRLFICPTNPTVVSPHAHYGWPSLLRRALVASLQTYMPPIFLYLFQWLNISPTCILVSPMHRTGRLFKHKSTPRLESFSVNLMKKVWMPVSVTADSHLGEDLSANVPRFPGIPFLYYY